MKKILALTLAAVMALGTTTVAFAGAPTAAVAAPLFYTITSDNGAASLAGGAGDFYRDTDGDGDIELANSEIELGTKIYLPLAYENNDDAAKVGATLKGVTAPGTTSGTTRAQMTANEMKKYKVKADLTVGKDVFDDIKIEYVKFDGMGYAYAVAFYTNKEATTKLADVAGDLIIYRTSVKNPNPKTNANSSDGIYSTAANLDDHVWGTLNLNYSSYGRDAVRLDGLQPTPYTVQPKDDDNYQPVVKFSGQPALDEVTIIYNGVGEHEVNVADQGALYLGFSREYISSIGDAHPEVNMEFVSFLGKPKFNKWGKFYMYANEGDVLYQVINDELVLVDTTWDEDYEALVFRARELGTFVIADAEIDTAKTTTDEPKDNPPTGR